MKTQSELYQEWKARPVLLQETITDIETAIAFGFGQGVNMAREEADGLPADRSADFTKEDDKTLEDAMVDMIYKAYPRKEAAGTARISIRKALRKITGTELLAAVNDYAKAVATWPIDDRKKFVPHPATWFNQERWLDDRSNWYRGVAVSSPGMRVHTE